jgi:hypothetical protein
MRIRVFYYLRTMQEPAPVELLDKRDERVPEPKPVVEVPIGEPVPGVWVYISRSSTLILKEVELGPQCRSSC